MNKLYETENKFKSLNGMLSKDGIVIMGSTYASGLPLNELLRNYGLNYRAYNRSAENLTIDNAQTFFEECVLVLEPSKLFLNLGECDLETMGAEDAAEKYQWLLYQIHNALPECRIYLLSVALDSDAAKKFNSRIEHIAASTGCSYIDIRNKSYLETFLRLKTFFHEKRITFADAMMA